MNNKGVNFWCWIMYVEIVTEANVHRQTRRTGREGPVAPEAIHLFSQAWMLCKEIRAGVATSSIISQKGCNYVTSFVSSSSFMF